MRTLKRHDFRVIVVSRHPLDVLISILHFAGHEPETARWLGGAFGDERSIIGAEPSSPAFREYAASRRARALIDVSPQWWEHALVSLRYEDLVATPRVELARIVDAVGVPPVLSPDRVTDTVTFDALRTEAANQHFWQGKPNHWRELLTGDVATELARPHTRVIRRLGYDVQPNPELTQEAATSRWEAKLAVDRTGPGPISATAV